MEVKEDYGNRLNNYQINKILGRVRGKNRNLGRIMFSRVNIKTPFVDLYIMHHKKTFRLFDQFISPKKISSFVEKYKEFNGLIPHPTIIDPEKEIKIDGIEAKIYSNYLILIKDRIEIIPKKEFLKISENTDLTFDEIILEFYY